MTTMIRKVAFILVLHGAIALLSGCVSSEALTIGSSCKTCAHVSQHVCGERLMIGGPDLIVGTNPEPKYNPMAIEFYVHKSIETVIEQIDLKHCDAFTHDGTQDLVLGVDTVSFRETRHTLVVEPEVEVCLFLALGETVRSPICSGYINVGSNKWGVFGRSDQTDSSTNVLYEKAFMESLYLSIQSVLLKN